VIEIDQEEELRNYTSSAIINNPNIYFLRGEGCGGRYRAAFQHVAGQSKAAKINKIRQRKLNLCRAERAESSRPRPRPGHGKRRVRFD